MSAKAMKQTVHERSYRGEIIGVDLEEAVHRLSIILNIKEMYGMPIYYVKGEEEIKQFFEVAGVSRYDELKNRSVAVYFSSGKLQRIEYLP